MSMLDGANNEIQRTGWASENTMRFCLCRGRHVVASYPVDVGMMELELLHDSR
jgi:hypothetical protein